MKCPRKNCDNPAIDHPTLGIIPCQSCQDSEHQSVLHRRYEFASISRHNRTQADRDAHGKDILQPFIGNKPNPDFVKAYPELAKEYYQPHELEKL